VACRDALFDFVATIGVALRRRQWVTRVIRNIISFKSIGCEIKRLVRPNGVFDKLQGELIYDDVRHSVMRFCVLRGHVTLLLYGVVNDDRHERFMAVLWSATAAWLNVLGTLALQSWLTNFLRLRRYGDC